MGEKRILFVLPRMVSGGVERVTLNLISMWRAEGVECALALRKCHGEMLAEAQSLVTVHELAANGIVHFVPRLSQLIRSWQPTHVVTAFADVALLAWLALKVARSDARLVHGVHDTHGDEAARPGLRGRMRHTFNNAMAGIVYRHASAVVTVSDGVRDEVLRKYPVPPSRVQTIYNPVISEEQLVVRADARAGLSDRPVRIVALGRLARQKGFDVLVSAMARIDVDRPWTLDVHGEGPERTQLEALIGRLALDARVRLHGYTATPFAVLRDADVFVLPSRHEGLPTVLIEALACQTQIVASDCPHGPREILEDGRLGLLVPPEDAAALSDAITRAITSEHWVEPRLLRHRARDFSLAASLAKWNDLLDSLRIGKANRAA